MRGVQAQTSGDAGSRTIQLEAASLRLRIDAQPLRLELEGPRGERLTLVPHTDAAELRAVLADPAARLTTALGEIRARGGPALRAELQLSRAGRAGLRLCVEMPADARGVSLQLVAENRSATPLAVSELSWVTTSAADIALPSVNDVHGLDPAGPGWSVRPGSDPRIRAELLLFRGGGPLVVGHTTALRARTHVECELRGKDPVGLALSTRIARRALAPGELFESERAWIGLGTRVAELLEEWARRVGLEMDARAPVRGLAAWSSRRVRGRGKTAAQAIESQLAMFRTLSGARVVELDERFAPDAGDWRSTHQLARLADRIAQAGLVPGLTLSPFAAPRGSRLLVEHPDARLRGARGRRVTLDPAHPAVLSMLSETFERLRTLGFGAFVLEGLGASTGAGSRTDGALDPVEAYRRALAGVRAAVGDDALLVGADAPYVASVGALDAVCSGAAAPRRWRERVGASRPGAERNARAALFGALGAQRLWLADPGGVTLSDADLSRAEVQTLLSLIGLGGGWIRTADDLGALDTERLGWLRRVLPPLAREVRAPAPGAQILATPLLGARLAVVVWNASDRAEPIGLRLLDVECRGPHHVYEFWRDRYLGVIDDALPPREVPPHGCRVLGLTPVADRPQVVGSDLHIGMGTLEVASLRASEGGLRLALRHRGDHEGAVYVAPARAREARRVDVGFRDSQTLSIGP